MGILNTRFHNQMFNFRSQRFLLLLFLLTTLIYPSVVQADYIRIEGSVVNVRQGPGTTFPVLFQAEAGEEYPLVSFEGLWCRITLDDGREAWVFRRLVAVLRGTMPGAGKHVDGGPTKTGKDGIGQYFPPAGLLVLGVILVWKRKKIVGYWTRKMGDIVGYRREKPFRYDERPPEKDRWEL